MNEKLLNHFAEYNNTEFTESGEYFQGDPPERALFEVLNIPVSQLKPFAIELIKSAKENETVEKNLNEFSRGVSAYTQFQDILDIVSRETDQEKNRHYCYYESLMYLREIGACFLDKNFLAAFTLLRPFMELSILHLYWFIRCEEKGYHPYYEWLNGTRNKPPFKNIFDYVFKNLPTRDYVDSERVSHLRKVLKRIYRTICAYNHSPKIEESVITLSGGHNRLSFFAFFYFLCLTNILLRQLVYLYVLVYPMSLFPVERYKKWGFGGPVGIFIDPVNFAYLRSFLGEENLSRLQEQLEAFPQIQDLVGNFERLPDLSEEEIEKSWRELRPSQSEEEIEKSWRERHPSQNNETDRPVIILRLTAAKAKIRSIRWALNYIQNSPNEREIPQEALDKLEGMIRDW